MLQELEARRSITQIGAKSCTYFIACLLHSSPTPHPESTRVTSYKPPNAMSLTFMYSSIPCAPSRPMRGGKSKVSACERPATTAVVVSESENVGVLDQHYRPPTHSHEPQTQENATQRKKKKNPTNRKIEYCRPSHGNATPMKIK